MSPRDRVPARHPADLGDHVYIGYRTATESHEARWIETTLEVLEPVGDRVSFFPRRCDVQELTFSDNRSNLMDRYDQDIFPVSHRNPL